MRAAHIGVWWVRLFHRTHHSPVGWFGVGIWHIDPSADSENVAVASPPAPRSPSPPWLNPSSPPSRRSSSRWSAESYCSHPPLIIALAAVVPQPAQEHPPDVTAPDPPHQTEVPKPQRSRRRLDRQPQGVWRPAGFRDGLFFGEDSDLIRLRFSKDNLLKLTQLLTLL